MREIIGETAATLVKDGPVVESRSPAASSLGMLSNEALLNAAQNAQASGVVDPLAGHFRKESLHIVSTVDPRYKGFAVGDSVYHKIRKQEAKVVSIIASGDDAGKVIIKFTSGGKGKTSADNLVKL